MTKRQALLRPHFAALSDSKKSTRPPSSKRLSEAEAITRLEPLGWTIISGYAGLSEPCLMRHRCGLALSRLTPKRLSNGKQRLCPVCDKLKPTSWVNNLSELGQYVQLVTQGQMTLDTSVAPYHTGKLPVPLEKIPCRCEHGTFTHSIRAILHHQQCCAVAAYQLKQTYTLGRMQQQLLAPFKVFLADYPTLDEHDTRLVRGDEPLVVCCTKHGQLPRSYTPFELQKLVFGSRPSQARSPCFRCQPKQNELTAETVIRFFNDDEPFTRIGVRLALLSSAEEIDAEIASLVAHQRRPSKELRLKVRAMSPTYGLVADTLSISWNDLLKGKHLLPISGGRHSAAHFLFYILLTHAGLTVKNEVKLVDEAHPQQKIFLDLYVEEADLYFEMDGGPHFRPMYGKAQKNQAQRFSEQQQRDALKTALLGDKLRRISTFDVIKQKELAGKVLIDKLVAERDRLLLELGRPVIPFDPKTLSGMQDIRLIFNGWPDKINTMSAGFYQYQGPALDVSPDHVQVICQHGHESVFNIYEFSKIFDASSKQTYSEYACKGCQQVKKRAKIADEISTASEEKLSLITDYFLKNSRDPILVNIVKGNRAGQIALFSSHNAAKSRKYYTAFAQSLMSEQPLKKPVTVFTSLNEAVAARDQLLQS
jgi:hypothetical protein